jgi:hypothetical protein
VAARPDRGRSSGDLGALSLAGIEEAERNLKDVLFKQSLLKKSVNEAKATLKQMVASFIDQLGQLSDRPADYHDTMESLAQAGPLYGRHGTS